MQYIVEFTRDHAHIALSFVSISFIFVWMIKMQGKLQLNWQMALIVATIHTVFGVGCMRVMAILEVGGNLEKAAYLRLYGAIFALPVAYLLWAKLSKRNVSLVMDASAVSTVLGMITARCTCLINGCCVGTLITESGTMRWPIREVEFVFYFIFVAFYWNRIYRGKTYGQVYPIYMMSYGILRFILEWVRVEFTTQFGILRLAHIWSLLSLVSGATAFYFVCKKKRKSVSQKKTQRIRGKADMLREREEKQ